MLDDVVRRELDGLVDIALLLMREDTHLVLRQQEIAGVFFDIFEIQQVLARYKQWRFPTDRDDIAFEVRLYHGGDIRGTARGFIGKVYEEIRDIICNKKRRTEAAKLSRGGLAPTCAGLAAFISSKFGLTEPIATIVGTYLLIVLLEATQGAFCQMTKEAVRRALHDDDESRRRRLYPPGYDPEGDP